MEKRVDHSTLECLARGEVDTVAVKIPASAERLSGLAAELDYRLGFPISRAREVLSGDADEVTLLPLEFRHGEAKLRYRLVLVGTKQGEVTEAGCEKLLKNLATLRAPAVAISRTDFGSAIGAIEKWAKKNPEVAAWITP